MRCRVRLLAGCLFALGMGVNLQSFSQGATLLPAQSASQAGSQATSRPTGEPGRLFFSPERRQVLDQQRKTKSFQETVVEGETLTLNGIVSRSSGKWTVWVNGSPVTESDSSSVAVAPVKGSSSLGRMNAATEGGTPSVVAVGNAVDRSTGVGNSLLGTGSIRVHSRSPGR